jgi:hypothetical protein
MRHEPTNKWQLGHIKKSENQLKKSKAVGRHWTRAQEELHIMQKNGEGFAKYEPPPPPIVKKSVEEVHELLKKKVQLSLAQYILPCTMI